MKNDELIHILKSEFGDLVDGADSPAFRCSAYLCDGLYIPCVAFKSSEDQTALALRRFDETRADQQKAWWKGPKKFGKGMQYPDIVKSFVCSGSHVAWHHITRIERSPFALTHARLMEIKGETSMSWTQFTGRMSDGKEFEFGTPWSRDFFMMPGGYSAADIAKIEPAERGTRPNNGQTIYRERPFFVCYLDGL